MDAFELLEAGRRGRPVIYFIGTVPPSLRASLASEKAWRKLTARWIARLKRDFKLDYGAERSDPAGEDEITWHPHINLLFVRTDGQGWIDQEEISRAWKETLYYADLKEIRRATNAGELSIEESLAWLMRWEAQPVDIYLHYSREAGEIYFWCDYLGRPWPRWAEGHKYMLRVKWFGNRPKRPVREKEHLCPRCGLRVYKMQCGSEESAEQLRSMGYARIRDECEERFRVLRRSRPAKFQKFTATVSAQGVLWTPERKEV